MCRTDDEQFRGAVAAVLLTCSAEEKVRIERDLRALQALSAAMSGVPVDFSTVAGAMKGVPEEEKIGLLGLWHQSGEGA